MRSGGRTAVELKARLKQALAGVEGWLYFNEAWALHEMVRNLGSREPAVYVVEIGSWKGRSTIALALGVQARGAGTVFAIDPHTGAPDGVTFGWIGSHTAGGPPVTVTEFQRNIAAAGVASLVRCLVSTSHDARPQFAEQSVDFLFIDGSHRYEDVKIDITDWQTALKDEAIIAFNDLYAPGVYRVIRELVARSGTDYRRPALVQNTLFFEFHRRKPWSITDSFALLRLQAAFQLRFKANRFRQYMPDWLVRTGHALSSRLIGHRIGA